jgi:hypothetical protein
MVGHLIRRLGLRQRAPLWPFCPPDFLSDFLRRLLVRGGFLRPSLDGGLPLFELFFPGWRSGSAMRAFNYSVTSACRWMINSRGSPD